jgi:hypothetical protein
MQGNACLSWKPWQISDALRQADAGGRPARPAGGIGQRTSQDRTIEVLYSSGVQQPYRPSVARGDLYQP